MKALPVVVIALVSFLAGGLLVTSLLLPKPDTGAVDIRRVDATASYVQSGTELTLAPLIENSRKTDSGSIRLDIKVKRQGGVGVVGEGNNTIGFLKAGSSQAMGIFLPIEDSGTGTYSVEMAIFEDGKEIRTRAATVTIPEPPKPTTAPSRLRFLDLQLALRNLTETSAQLEVTPRVFNDGGVSGIVRAQVDFLHPTIQTPRIIVAQGQGFINPISSNREGAAAFSLALPLTPPYKEAPIELQIDENGVTVLKGKLSTYPLNLTTLASGKPVLLPVITEGVPPPPAAATPAPTVGISYVPPTPTPKPSPGFEALFAVAALGLAAIALRRRR